MWVLAPSRLPAQRQMPHESVARLKAATSTSQNIQKQSHSPVWLPLTGHASAHEAAGCTHSPRPAARPQAEVSVRSHAIGDFS